jgi:DNA invertase Pin-like site-specific DNA recombinase
MHPNLPLSQVKITSLHLERKAVIYIRQSSPKQVREHLDSQLTQRPLVRRAQSLGWHPERIEVFDGDLGQSATGVQELDAFKALAADVALGHVGIVFGWQVSRLARNNAEWYQLLDVAALVGTLIGDTDGVYDPRLYNDRLLLGLKDTMSEAELYLMRQRLNAGRLSKVQRGEYVQRLPTGLVRLADNRVIKDPDRQIQHVIELVFSTFEDIGSGYGVLRYCKQHDILLPRRHGGGPGDVRWRKPSEAAIRAILTNPAYAGAFVYGRRTSAPRRPSLSRVGFLRVVIMPILLPSCMSRSLLLPEASRGLGHRQHRQGGCLLLWHRDSRPGFGDKAAQGQRCLVEQRHQDQVPAAAKDTHQPQACGTPRPRLLGDEGRDVQDRTSRDGLFRLAPDA